MRYALLFALNCLPSTNCEGRPQGSIEAWAQPAVRIYENQLITVSATCNVKGMESHLALPEMDLDIRNVGDGVIHCINVLLSHACPVSSLFFTF